MKVPRAISIQVGYWLRFMLLSSAGFFFEIDKAHGVNSAPTISPIPDQAVVFNEIVPPIPFVIFDSDSPVSNLAVNATSSNTNLVPNENLSFSCLETNCTLTILPFPCRSGTVTITLSVSDESGTTTSQSFNFTVDHPAPRLITDVPDQVDSCHEAPTIITFSLASDPGWGPPTISGHSLNQQLVEDAAIFFGGSGTNQAFYIPPPCNKSGSTIITLKVSYANGLTDCTAFRYMVTAPNVPPTIAVVPDQQITQDTVLGPLPVIIGDVETEANFLSLSGTSSNPNLVPDANIVFGGSGSNRTVTITPAPNQTGRTTVSLSVSDGLSDTVSQFDLAVNSANQAPTISLIPDQVLIRNTTGVVYFQVSDVETPAADLQVMASSSDARLIPETRFQIGGGGTNRTLSFESTNCNLGTASISVTVRDIRGAVTTTSFLVNVQFCQGLPSIPRIDDQVFSANAVLGPLALYFDDPCICDPSRLRPFASSNKQGLIPDNNIQFSGYGNQRQAFIIPAANQNGSAVIKFSVLDDVGGIGTTSFTVTVVPAPRISITNREFHFSQSLPPGDVVIEASTNLVDWLPFATNSVAGGALNFTDATASNFVARFYRLASPTTTR